MIIKNLNLRSFGKFKDKNIEFGDGFNVVYGKNEAGKSTVSTAIKTFFYHDINAKKKYKKNCVPIGETKGSYDVTVSGDDNEIYESYVTLGKTNSKTLIKTVKKPLDEPLGNSDIPIGEYFFSLDEALFDSVFYIKDLNGYENITDSSEAVSSTLAGSGSQAVIDVDISKVLEDIKSELNAYGRKTSTGKIYPLTEALSGIEKDLYNLESVKNSIRDTEEKTEYIKSRIEKNEKTIKNLNEEKEKSIAYKEYTDAMEQISLRKKIDELKEKLDKEEIQLPVITEEEISFIKNTEASIKSESKKSIWLILSGVAFALSVIGGFLSPVLFAGIGAALVLFAIAYKEGKKDAENKKDAERLNEILSRCNIKGYDDYTKKVQLKEKEAYEKKIIETELSHLYEKVSDYKEEYKDISVEKPSYTEAEIEESLLRINKEVTELKIEEVRIREQKKNAFNNLPDYDSLIKEKEELTLKIAELSKEQEIAADAYNILEETAGSFKASYLPFLQERTKEILLSILDEEVDYLSIKEDFTCELRVKSDTQIKDSEYLSNGTRDLVNFALRLAIYELICDNYSIPLILDDCFIELDDERFEKTVKYIIENFKNQVIYFTAHKRIFNLPLEKCMVINI